MNINDSIKVIAGSFILISVFLGHFVNANWFFLTAFVGINLVQSSFTKWCLMETILKKAGVREGGESCSV
jgi:hypothetical protein